MKFATRNAIEPTATACPVYVALIADDFLDASDDLDELLEQLVADKADQDVAVWDNMDSLVAVVLSGGTVHRFAQPRSTPPLRVLEGS